MTKETNCNGRTFFDLGRKVTPKPTLPERQRLMYALLWMVQSLAAIFGAPKAGSTWDPNGLESGGTWDPNG
jgi:hypothetical protein